MKTALALLLSLTAFPAAAQQPVCMHVEQIMRMLTEQHNEKVIWSGTIPGQGQAVLMQSETGSWSWVFIKGTVACLHGAGKDGNSIVPTGLGI